MGRAPCSQIAPAQATMMKNATTAIRTHPTTTSTRVSRYCLLSMPFSTIAA